MCLALALFAALGYFHIQAIFIDFFSGLLKGLLGYGFWLMPPALLLAACMLVTAVPAWAAELPETEVMTAEEEQQTYRIDCQPYVCLLYTSRCV